MCISMVGAVSEHLPPSPESGTVADRAPATCLGGFFAGVMIILNPTLPALKSAGPAHL